MVFYLYFLKGKAVCYTQQNIYNSQHGSHSSWKAKFPAFSLWFPCVIPVFPAYFRNKMTAFLTSKIHPSMSRNNFFVHTFLISTFYLKIFKFHVFFQNFQIPCVFPVWNYFSPFSLFSLWSGNPEFS